MAKKYVIIIIILVIFLLIEVVAITYDRYPQLFLKDTTKLFTKINCSRSSNKRKCEEICQKIGGKLTADGSIFGPMNYRCDFPYKDAGKTCKNSDQCQESCLLTQSQLEDLAIPHFPDSNQFGYDGRIYDGKKIIEKPLTKIIMSDSPDSIGICQDYEIDNLRGAYELNNGVATLKKGTIMIY